MSKLRFGLLCDSHEAPAWAGDCVRQVLATGHAELVVVIQDVVAAPVRDLSARQLLFRVYERYWVRRRSAALRAVDLKSATGSVAQLQCRGSGDASGFLDRGDVEKIQGYALDFILSLSARCPREDLMRIPRWGVWSYRHARETAPYFWEILSGRAKTEAILEKLNGAVGNAICLHRGYFGTCKASWVENLDGALFGSADFCASVCAELALAGSELRGEHSSSTTSTRAPPENGEMVRFMLTMGLDMLAQLWRLLFHVEVWNVGFTTQSVEQILRSHAIDGSSVSWCSPHRSGDFIADPFVYHEQGQARVLVEDYVQGRGRISEVMQPGRSRTLELAVQIEPPYHLSYPCIFQEAGEVYCVPEGFQSGKACLYRRVRGGWELVRTMLEGQPVVDPTLFKHGGLYWLLYTRQDDGAWGSLKLYAAYAEHLDGDWTPHPLNPIKCDIGSSRPAGTPVLVDGQLHRPSQDCSETYGGAVVVNRIVKLSRTEFEEVEVARIEPLKESPYPAGLHTLNAMGSGSVFDGKKLGFDWFAWRKNAYLLRQMFK